MTIPLPSPASTGLYDTPMNSGNAALNRLSIADGGRPQSRQVSCNAGGLHLVSRSGSTPTNAAGQRLLKQSGLRAGLQKLSGSANAKDRGPRGPHPGDILYWVTCLGAACLLLLAAT